MSNPLRKIPLYAPRGVGQRLLTALDFLQQNFIVLFRNATLCLLPFVFLQAYFTEEFINNKFDFIYEENPNYLNSIGLILAIILSTTALFAIVGSIIRAYGNGEITKKTTLSELQSYLFPNAIKTFLLLMFIAILTFLAYYIVDKSNSVGMTIILLILMVALWPSLSMIFFPVYFEDTDVAKSFTKGVRIGFQYWGSTFLILFVISVGVVFFQYLCFLIVVIWEAFKTSLYSGETSIAGEIISWIIISLCSLVGYLILIFMFLCIAFQYLGIREEQEGISLKQKIDDFENL